MIYEHHRTPDDHLTPEIAEAVRTAVAAGEYASSSEVVREALRDWRHKRALQRHELAELRAQIQRGIDDLDAGRSGISIPSESLDRTPAIDTPAAPPHRAGRRGPDRDLDRRAERRVLLPLRRSCAKSSPASSRCWFTRSWTAPGRPRARLAVHFHQKYALYYRHTDSEVVIVRVLHGSRDARALLGEGDASP